MNIKFTEMRALTTSEINAILIAKGYNSSYIIRNIPENKWGGDVLKFVELEDGSSSCAICKFIPSEYSPLAGRPECRAYYSELKAAEKKEFQAFIEALPNK